jgi:1-acyl-sn-glycerol-3-phosphate acyltransferase
LVYLLVGTFGFILAWLVLRPPASRPEARIAAARVWTSRWLAHCARSLGLRVTVTGKRPPDGSLIAPNHVGYVDVVALGSVLPCFFVAKIDVESWPLVGFLFKTSHNIGVPRVRAKALVETTRRVAERLRAGHSVCVFLEGTSSGGGSLLPFYPPLVQPAIDAGAPVVPVALRWRPTSPAIDVAEDIAYWKDHTFGPHAWRLLGLTGICVEVEFGDPIPPADFTRRSLAERAHAEVARLCGYCVAAVD